MSVTTHENSWKMKNKKKSVFRQMYDALPTERPQAPKTAWVNDIAALVKVHPTTVRCWLAGTQKPDPLRISIIAKHLSVKEENLFNA